MIYGIFLYNVRDIGRSGNFRSTTFAVGAWGLQRRAGALHSTRCLPRRIKDQLVTVGKLNIAVQLIPLNPHA